MFEYDQSEHRECTRKRLDKHKIIIHEAIWHQCDICRYRSTQGIHLENHKKVKHAHKPVSLNKKTEILCNACPADLKKSQKRSRQHRETIHDGRIFQCNQCDKILSNMENLTSHIRAKHNGVRY